MTQTSNRLDLPLLMPSQAQKHVIVNEALLRLDDVVHAYIKSRSVMSEPATPEEGDSYILPDGKTGAEWDVFAVDDMVVFEEGRWRHIRCSAGMVAYVADDSELTIFDGTAWQSISLDHPSVSTLGINTVSDPNNRLSVKSDSVLFSHDDNTPGTGDMRQVLNKSGVTTVAGTLFQTDWVGRAQMGLLGNDDFTLQTSSDGSQFVTALTVDHLTGECAFPNSRIGDRSITVFDQGTGTYTPPVNVRSLKITLVGAGGGGAGARSETTSNTVGAGGGGAGAVVIKFVSTADLEGSYAYSVGAGGAGGQALDTDPFGSRNGANGGATTLSSSLLSLSATGGSGAPEDAGNSQFNAGLGGTASGGDINIDGQRGGAGFTKASDYYQIGTGVGASTILGMGGTFANGNGSAGVGYGSGGSGCGMIPGFILNRAGGDGASGLILIEEYY